MTATKASQAIGHQPRYRKASLGRAIEAADLQVEVHRRSAVLAQRLEHRGTR